MHVPSPRAASRPSRRSRLGLAAGLLAASAAGLRGQALEQSNFVYPYYAYSNYWSSALDVDADHMVVGAPHDSEIWPLLAHGAVTFHHRDASGAWVFDQRLFASDYAHGDSLGFAVAIDGDFAAVTALQKTWNGVVQAGAVYLYHRDSTTGLWSEQQQIGSSAPAGGEFFGRALALKGDVLLVGAPNTVDPQGVMAGSVYVFRRDTVSGIWSQETQLFDDDANPGASFGTAVGFDGTLAAIGAPGALENTLQNAGSVNLFTVAGTTWTRGPELLGTSTITSANFGAALVAGGRRVAIGAPAEYDGGNYYVGMAYVFVKDLATGTWSIEQKIHSPTGQGSGGFGAALHAHGNELLIGAYDDATGGGHLGSAWVWRFGKKSGGPWHLENELRASDALAADDFGCAVAVGDEELIVASRFNDTASGTDTGRVYVYDRAEFTLTITPTTPAPGAPILLEAHRGAPGAPIWLVVEAIDGAPMFLPVLLDVFASDCTWELAGSAPNPLLGFTATFRTYKISAGGPVIGSNAADLDL